MFEFSNITWTGDVRSYVISNIPSLQLFFAQSFLPIWVLSPLFLPLRAGLSN